MQFGVLGPLDIVVCGRPASLRPVKQRILLAVLLGNANTPTPTQRLIDSLWAEAPPSAVENLRLYVYHLRKLLGDGNRVVRHPSGYALTVRPGELDAGRFAELAADGAKALAAEDAATASALLTQALALWRGPAYGDLADHPAVRPEAVRLEEDRLRATERRVQADLALGRHDELIGELTVLVEEQPTRERLRAHLMLALHRAGRRADALETYREGREILVRELGLEPGTGLRRMHEAILRGDEPAAGADADGRRERRQLPVPAQLPHDIADFVGRADELDELDKVLESRLGGGDAPAFLGVTGMGGVGKTALAIRWARRVAHRFPDGQLYVDLRGYTEDAEPLTPYVVVDRFLRALGVAGARIPGDLDERTGLLRSVLAKRRVLLVLDNARDSAQVRPLLPGAPGCAVIVTSREGLEPLSTWEGAHVVRLATLGTRDAVALLASVAGAAHLRHGLDDPDFAQLSTLCAGLPLALRIAGARLAGRSQLSPARLVALVADERTRLSELSHRGVQIRAHFELSYRALDTAAATLFRRLSLLDVPDFAPWTGAALLDGPEDGVRVLLEQLVDAQLLEVGEDAGGTRYRFHDLVRLFARERAFADDGPQERAAALARVVGGWLAVAQEAHRREYGGDHAVIHGAAPRWQPDRALVAALVADPLAWLAAERVGLVSAVVAAAAAGMAEAAWDLAMTCVTLFEAHSLHDDWQHTHIAALAAARQAGDERGAAAMLYGLGSLALYQQDYTAAAESLGAAAEQFERLGEEHGLGLALRNLALLHRTTGALTAAREHYVRARDLLAAHGDRAAYAHVLIGIAQIHLDQGAVETADDLLAEALRTFREIGNRRGHAQVLFRLGETRLRAGRAEEAQQAFAAAQPVVRHLGDLVGEAYVLRGLGEAQLALGRTGDAARTMAAAVRAAQRVGEQFAEATATYGLGDVHAATAQRQRADTCYARAAELFAAMGNRPWQARALHALALVTQEDGDTGRARELWERALTLVEGTESPVAAEIEARLAS